MEAYAKKIKGAIRQNNIRKVRLPSQGMDACLSRHTFC